MSTVMFSHEEIVREAKFSPEDMAEIQEQRQDHTRLGFAYQLAFVRLTHRFPAQQPLEIIDDLLVYVSVQLDIPTDKIDWKRHAKSRGNSLISVILADIV